MPSKIEWTGETWNPITGCTRASTGCDHCYAVTMSARLEHMGREKYFGLTSVNGKGDRHFNGTVKTHEDELLKPLRWKKPKTIFVNSMSDTFHKNVPFEFIDRMFAVMLLCPQHTFQVLTKRPERMAEWFHETAQISEGGRLETRNRVAWAIKRLAEDSKEVQSILDSLDETYFKWPLPNVWIGTTTEDQEAADKRIPHLLECPAEVRFLSVEPMVGPVDLAEWLYEPCPKCEGAGNVSLGPQGGMAMAGVAGDCDADECDWCKGDGIDTNSPREAGLGWVICGGESGPDARPMHPGWARSLRDECAGAGVPFFFKQWGALAPLIPSEADPEVSYLACRAGDPAPPLAFTSHTFPDGLRMARVGKHVAGRLLDGRTHDELPAVRA